jgi:hypothetical protein
MKYLSAGILVLALAACGEAPSSNTAAAEPQLPPIVPPPPPSDPLAVGSVDARDDLYCAGMIYVENPSPPSALNPTDEAILRKAQALGVMLAESGINKLVEQKAAHATHAAMIVDAYTDQAERDLAAKKPRFSLDACNERAKALPPPPQ